MLIVIKQRETKEESCPSPDQQSITASVPRHRTGKNLTADISPLSSQMGGNPEVWWVLLRSPVIFSNVRFCMDLFSCLLTKARKQNCTFLQAGRKRQYNLLTHKLGVQRALIRNSLKIQTWWQVCK